MEKHYHALIPGQVFCGAAEDMQQASVEEGVHVVVDLRQESSGCASNVSQVAWVHVPLGDLAEKTETALVAEAIQAVVSACRRGQKVAFHCGGGKGRTGMVAAGVLLELGLCSTVAEAEQKAQSIRPQININPLQRAALEQLYPH